MAHFRLQFDVATEHGGEFAGDGQAQSRAGVLACDGAVDLAKFIEDLFLQLKGNAGAVVGDGNLDVGRFEARGARFFG